MTDKARRQVSHRLFMIMIAALGALAIGAVHAQEAPKSVRIGYAVSKTGRDAPGASASTTPNYQMWIKEVNAAGGLMLKAYGKRVPIEAVEYDDQSQAEEAIRATGVDLSRATRNVVEKHGFKLVYDKSYPPNTQDMSPILNEVKALNPDSFIAFSYPPDTFLLTDQAKVLGFNPKVFYAGVGTALPGYKKKNGASLEGVMGPGGADLDSPAIQDYFKRHTASAGYEPDRWTSAVTWSSLQVLQQAVERVGKIDREAITREIKTGTFDTIVGPVKMENQMFRNLWFVGQWQGGEFYGVAPKDKKGAKTPLIPKPAWK